MRGHAGTQSLLGNEMTDWRLISFQSPYRLLLNRQTDRQIETLLCHRSAADFESLHGFNSASLSGVPRANYPEAGCSQRKCNFELYASYAGKTLYIFCFEFFPPIHIDSRCCMCRYSNNVSFSDPKIYISYRSLTSSARFIYIFKQITFCFTYFSIPKTRQYVPPNYQYTSTRLNRITSHKMGLTATMLTA